MSILRTRRSRELAIWSAVAALVAAEYAYLFGWSGLAIVAGGAAALYIVAKAGARVSHWINAGDDA